MCMYIIVCITATHSYFKCWWFMITRTQSAKYHIMHVISTPFLHAHVIIVIITADLTWVVYLFLRRCEFTICKLQLYLWSFFGDSSERLNYWISGCDDGSIVLCVLMATALPFLRMILIVSIDVYIRHKVSTYAHVQLEERRDTKLFACMLKERS